MRKKLNTSSSVVRLIGVHLSELESRHWIAGDRALALRDDETLQLIASQETLVAQYWRAVCLNRAGLPEQSSDALRHVIAVAPAPLQAKALYTLGTVHLGRGDYGGAGYLYALAQRAVADPVTALGIKRMQSVLLSLTGEHILSLDEMEQALPLLRSIPLNHPARLDFYNSCAVELIAVGRPEEARPFVRTVIASPLITVYPEWRATARELDPATPPPPTKALSHPQPEPARILHFPDRPVESGEARRVRAVIVASSTESKLLLTGVLKLENASEERRQICCDILDAAEPNAQLAAWASKAAPHSAASVLRIARRTAEVKPGIVRQLKRD